MKYAIPDVCDQPSEDFIFENRKTSFSVNLSENFLQIYLFGSCYINFNFFAVSSFMKIFVA